MSELQLSQIGLFALFSGILAAAQIIGPLRCRGSLALRQDSFEQCPGGPGGD